MLGSEFGQTEKYKYFLDYNLIKHANIKKLLINESNLKITPLYFVGGRWDVEGERHGRGYWREQLRWDMESKADGMTRASDGMGGARED